MSIAIKLTRFHRKKKPNKQTKRKQNNTKNGLTGEPINIVHSCFGAFRMMTFTNLLLLFFTIIKSKISLQLKHISYEQTVKCFSCFSFQLYWVTLIGSLDSRV